MLSIVVAILSQLLSILRALLTIAIELKLLSNVYYNSITIELLIKNLNRYAITQDYTIVLDRSKMQKTTIKKIYKRVNNKIDDKTTRRTIAKN